MLCVYLGLVILARRLLPFAVQPSSSLFHCPQLSGKARSQAGSPVLGSVFCSNCIDVPICATTLVMPPKIPQSMQDCITFHKSPWTDHGGLPPHGIKAIVNPKPKQEVTYQFCRRYQPKGLTYNMFGVHDVLRQPHGYCGGLEVLSCS